MKVVAINGSPRDGNTKAMLEKVLEGAKAAGAETELISLKEKEIKPCIGCFACEKTGKCVFNDDMQGIQDTLLAADAIVFGSPSYFDDVTGLMKLFIDRTEPFYNKLKGKKCALVSVGQAGEISIQRAIDSMTIYTEISEMNLVGNVIAEAKNAKEVLKNEKVMKKCWDLGKKLAAKEKKEA